MNPKLLSLCFLPAAATLAASAWAADLPIQEVILYKHGVGFFERGGELKPGESAQLAFKAGDMNDVLKSLTLRDASGQKIEGIRYDASESLDKRLQDFPFVLGQGASLSSFLDQMKGARLELKFGSDTIVGAIVSGRSSESSAKDKTPEKETVLLLLDSGEMQTFDLAAASVIKFSDPKLQIQLRDYLTVLSQARSRDLRTVYIDSTGSRERQLTASYMTPAAVWKASYRLIFGAQSSPTLEGWAIVDNTSGEDWNNVRLSVVSGKPISFITQLYDPRYVQRPEAELAEDRPIAPVVFEGAMTGAAQPAPPPGAPSPMAKSFNQARRSVQTLSDQLEAAAEAPLVQQSSIAAAAEGREAGELFEYNFASPVTVKKGESAMLPFLQQSISARKLLIYSERFGLHPMDAAELTNSTGKTLDGGPITVYDAGTYAGEALVETVKIGDKRLISYGVDLGTRVSTLWNSAQNIVREIHAHRGILTARTAAEETKTYTIKNVDAKPKTLIVEHPERSGYKLLDLKPSETTSDAYRFEVKLGPSATETLAVREERVFDQTIAVTSMTPDVLTTWVQNKALTDAGRRSLEEIARKKSAIATNDSALHNAESSVQQISQDEERVRNNIASLNRVSGQQEQVQKYAAQLASAETKLAALRDTQSDLRKNGAALESDLNGMIAKLEF